MYIPLIIFIIMLFFPGLTKSGAYIGLNLWFNTIIPTLLPYMIISGIVTHFNAFNIISKIIYPITRRLFKISFNANYCIIVGFLCGFPMGSKVIADMLSKQRISIAEANYLLCFCNNISPSFILNYVVASILLNQYKLNGHIIYTIFIIIFLSPIISSFIYRYCNKKDFLNLDTKCNNVYYSCDQNFGIIDKCISSSFENIFRIGGYIIIFSVISNWINNIDYLNKNLTFILSSIFEITSGLNTLRYTSISNIYGLTLVVGLCSFGGICSIAQTYSMVKDSPLEIKKYIRYKLINALISIILTITTLSNL